MVDTTYTFLQIIEVSRRLDECAQHMDQGHAIYMPDAIRSAVILINNLYVKNQMMEVALHRAQDELEGWFGNEPKESLGSVVKVTQTKTIEDTLKEIKEALA